MRSRRKRSQGSETITDEVLARLHRFLLVLASSPAALDRFIFDPVGIMKRYQLDPSHQQLLASGPVGDINARIWPEAVPLRGRAFAIEFIETKHGTPAPMIRGVIPPQPSFPRIPTGTSAPPAPTPEPLNTRLTAETGRPWLRAQDCYIIQR